MPLSLAKQIFSISTSTHLKVIGRGLCGRHRCEASKARPSAFILFHSFNRRLVYCYTFALPKKNKNVPWSPVNAEEFDIDKDLCLCTDDGFFVLQLRFQVAVLLGLLNVCRVRKLLLEGKIEWIEWINRKMNAYISVIRFNSFSHLIVWLWLQRSYFSSCDKEFYDTRWAETPAVSSVLISMLLMNLCSSLKSSRRRSLGCHATLLYFGGNNYSLQSRSLLFFWRGGWVK